MPAMIALLSISNIGRTRGPVRWEKWGGRGRIQGPSVPPTTMPDPLENAASSPTPGEMRCAGCGEVFVCGGRAGSASCWCAELPPRLPVPDASSACYCRTCLERLIADRA
ncbi:MAG TPA: cysteine-rich CWC family protein [Burkholderiales bacterium]|nr:cysteine-rich CWC family protein [Burkholderiales bacterium]